MNNPDVTEETASAKRRRLQQLVMGRRVNILTTPPRWLEEIGGYTKDGHGRHYIEVELDGMACAWVDKAWDRRCDAARWAKRNGATQLNHWYQC